MVADLSPLRGLPLKTLSLLDNRVTDLSPLQTPHRPDSARTLGLRARLAVLFYSADHVAGVVLPIDPSSF